MRVFVFTSPYYLNFIIFFKIAMKKARVLPFPDPSYTKQLLLFSIKSLHTIYYI
jgi:hypothetical protein